MRWNDINSPLNLVVLRFLNPPPRKSVKILWAKQRMRGKLNKFELNLAVRLHKSIVLKAVKVVVIVVVAAAVVVVVVVVSGKI